MPPQTMRQFLKPPEKAPDTLPRTQSTMSLLDYFSTVIQGLVDPTGWTEPKAEDFDNPHAYTQALKAHGVGQLLGMAAPLAAPLGVLTRGARTAGATEEATQTIRGYHGTKSASLIGDRLKPSTGGEFGPGIYIAKDPGMAEFHANNAIGPEGPSIMPVDVQLKNPFRVTKTDWIKMTEKSTPSQVQKRLIAKGHDGIIGEGLTGSEQIVAFTPEQVRSVFQQAPQTLKAFHGSPHDFEQFQKSAIGSGEGGQAYGYGHYFAQNPEVAAEYRRKLAKPTDATTTIKFDGKKISGTMPTNQLTPLERAALDVHSAGGNKQKAIAEAEKYLAYVPEGSPAHEIDKATLDALKAHDFAGRIEPITGVTYELNLHTSPESLLDWDKPLSQQHPAVQEALAKTKVVPEWYPEWNAIVKRQNQIADMPTGHLDPSIAAESDALDARLQALRQKYKIQGQHWAMGTDNQGPTGEQIYQATVSKAGGRHGHTEGIASQQLADAGIHGVQYLDQGSRTRTTRWQAIHPQGGINDFPDEASARAFVSKYPEHSLQGPEPATKNYVIFPHFEHLIEISKKYGISLPAAASLYKWQQSQKGVE